MKKKSPVLIIIVLVLIGAVIAGGLYIYLNFGARIIKVEEYEGKVKIDRDGDDIDIFEGLALKSGDEVSVKADSFLQLLIDSDKHMGALEGTVFSIVATGSEKNGKISINLIEGDALFEIDNKLPEGSEFEVYTSNATFSVRGTSFEVRYDDESEETYIEVTRGKVEAQIEDEELILEAGDSAIITEDEITINPYDSDLEEASIGDLVYFGRYEQDGKDRNGKEPMEWIVIDKNDEGVMLLSSKVIEYQEFLDDDTDDYYNWETSNIRDWLNSDFMELAFNDEQMDSIMLTNNPIPDTGLFNDKGTEATNDYVFLLSLNELNLLEQTNTLYIDSIAGTFYYAYLPEAAAQGTPYYDSLDYDLATLAEMSIDPEAYAEESVKDGYVSWYLRSSYLAGDLGVLVVMENGHVASITSSDDFGGAGVRPVIWVKY